MVRFCQILSYNLFLVLLAMFFSLDSMSQEKWSFKDNVSVDGFLKYSSSALVMSNDIISNNIFHNRINVNGYFADNVSTKISLRNRLVYGELVKVTPGYSGLMSQDDGVLDLSFLLIDEKAVVLHSIVDRLYLDYFKNNWQIRLGRQRINWGINLAWNSNDLFNAYNIVDFDYEEKAGSDALFVQKTFSSGANIDVAIKPGEDIDHTVVGALYKFNKHKYDAQLLIANYNKDIAMGVGWAGSLDKIGFKGETTYFKDKDLSIDATSVSTSLDYFFKKGMYINLSGLYNSNGKNVFDPSVIEFTSSRLSAKKLMPTTYSILMQISNDFNPRVNASITSIYGYGMDIVFVMPSVEYSISQNWDINLTGQLFYADVDDSFSNLSNSLYLRLEYFFD